MIPVDDVGYGAVGRIADRVCAFIVPDIKLARVGQVLTRDRPGRCVVAMLIDLLSANKVRNDWR